VVGYFTQAKAKVCLNERIKICVESTKFKPAFFSIILVIKRGCSTIDETMQDPSRNEQFQR
jgi:hypothetical protein